MHSLTKALETRGRFWLGAYALTTAFVTYFCMYAFRKPFTVATYEMVDGWTLAIDFKVAIVIAQVFGYALSKLTGIKVVAEASANRRALMIFGFILFGWFALFLFAVLPGNWKLLAIFLNGLPLGMIWGLVFAYLEGRRMSEILGAGLCASFIVSSGMVKSVGSWLMVDLNVPELWMPAATGAVFLPLLAVSVWLLSLTPPPNAQDKAERMERTPMYAAQRRAFFMPHAFGLTMLILAYVLLTALRDFRDNFAVEIWEALGFADTPAIFTLSEIPVAVVVLGMLAATVVIKNNRNAVLTYHWVILAGAAIVAGSTLGFQAGLVGPVMWISAVGAGLYMGYVPYNSVLVDRMTAALRTPGNAAFFLYMADASGYLGSVGLLLYRNFGASDLSWLNFFIGFCYVAAIGVTLTTLAAFIYFRRGAFHKDKHPMPAPVAKPAE